MLRRRMGERGDQHRGPDREQQEAAVVEGAVVVVDGEKGDHHHGQRPGADRVQGRGRRRPGPGLQPLGVPEEGERDARPGAGRPACPCRRRRGSDSPGRTGSPSAGSRRWRRRTRRPAGADGRSGSCRPRRRAARAGRTAPRPRGTRGGGRARGARTPAKYDWWLEDQVPVRHVRHRGERLSAQGGDLAEVEERPRAPSPRRSARRPRAAGAAHAAARSGPRSTRP